MIAFVFLLLLLYLFFSFREVVSLLQRFRTRGDEGSRPSTKHPLRWRGRKTFTGCIPPIEKRQFEVMLAFLTVSHYILDSLDR